jgi:hypothetical protein
MSFWLLVVLCFFFIILGWLRGQRVHAYAGFELSEQTAFNGAQTSGDPNRPHPLLLFFSRRATSTLSASQLILMVTLGASTLFLVNIAAFFFTAHKFAEFGYQRPLAHVAIAILTTLVIIFRAVNLSKLREPSQAQFIFEVACLSGVAHLAFFVASIFTFTVHPDRSDMLPVIEGAWRQIGLGGDPYSFLHVGSRTDNRMPYLPGTWLSFAPSALLGIDLRWSALLWKSIFTYSLLMSLKKNNSIAFSFMTILFFLSPHFNQRHELYFDFFLCVVFLMFSQSRARPKVSALLLGAAVLTRQWAWVLAPFLTLGLLWTALLRATPGPKSLPRKTGGTSVAILQSLKYGILGAGLILCPAALIVFRGGATSTLFDAVFAFQSERLLTSFRPEYGLSLMPILNAIGFERDLLKLPQLTLLLICLSAFLYQLNSITKVLNTGDPESHKISADTNIRVVAAQYSLLALSLFILMNPHFWSYFWLTPMAALLGLEMATTGAKSVHS